MEQEIKATISGKCSLYPSIIKSYGKGNLYSTADLFFIDRTMAKATEELPLSPFTLYLKEARIVKFKYKPDTMDYLYVRSNSYSPVGQPDYYVKYNLGNPDLIPFPFNEFYLPI